jgi:hypothetical protein
MTLSTPGRETAINVTRRLPFVNVKRGDSLNPRLIKKPPVPGSRPVASDFRHQQSLGDIQFLATWRVPVELTVAVCDYCNTAVISQI